jgi:hypothetical protein
MDGEFVTKPRMFCVNTFWFRNADMGPVKEIGTFTRGEMSLSRHSLGTGPQPWVSSTLGPKEGWSG